MFLSRSAKATALAAIIAASTGCSPSWTRTSIYPNRPSPAEEVLIRKNSIHLPAGIDFDHSSSGNRDEVCAEGTSKRFPLEITVVPARPGHRFSPEAQEEISKKEKEELEKLLKEAYARLSYYPENKQKPSGYVRKVEIFLLEDSVTEKTATQKLKEARIPLPIQYAPFAKTFFTFEDGFQLFLGQLQVQHLTYETGKETLTKPLNFTSYPSQYFYVVLDKIEKLKLKERPFKGRALRQALFTPLTSLRKEYALKIPPKKQKELGLSQQGARRDLPYGYGYAKNIDTKSKFRPLVLLKQNQKLWNELLPKLTSVKYMGSKEQQVEKYQIHLNLAPICQHAVPRLDIESQVGR